MELGVLKASVNGVLVDTIDQHIKQVSIHIYHDTQLTYEPSTCGYWEGARRRVPFQQNNS